MCNAFLLSKRNRLDAGELTELSYRDYYRTCSLLIDHFGRERRVADLRPVDFEAFRAGLAARYGVTSLLGVVNRCRVVFKFASDQNLIPQPVDYGQSFARPSKKLRRRTRKPPLDPADIGIVFLTRTRQRWIRTRKGETPEKHLHLNALSQAFAKLRRKLHINGRDGLNFYALRRQFEIVAGESKDQVAVDAVMGHTDKSMAAVYRQNVVSNERLRAVTNHVRTWLWPKRK